MNVHKTYEVCGNIADGSNPHLIFLVPFCIYVSWQLNGFVGSIPGLRGIFYLMSSLLVFSISAFLTPHFFSKFLFGIKGWLILLSFFLVIFINCILNIGQENVLLYIPSIIYLASYVYLSEKKVSVWLVDWILLNVIYKIVLTLIWLQKEPLIVKKYDHIGYGAADGITRSIVGYGAIYLIVPLIVILLAAWKGTNKWSGILIIATTILSIVLVYLSQVSMLIFALTVLLLIYALARKGRLGRTAVVVLLIAFVIYVFRIQILTFLASFDFLGTTVQSRITSLADVLDQDLDNVYLEYSGSMVAGDSVVNRFYSYEESIEALFHNFFLGYLTPDAFVGAGHSSIIDMIGRYGIFATFPIIYIVVDRYRYLVWKNKTARIPIILVFLYIATISCLNNLSLGTVFFLLYILIPQIIGLRNDEEPEEI